jgi:hypothetical protein
MVTVVEKTVKADGLLLLNVDQIGRRSASMDLRDYY